MKNYLNDLYWKDWLKFQKSWFIHNPPPRKKGVLVHPAKFPEGLVEQFIRFFTKEGQTVLDPMIGTGSTMLACLRSKRNCLGIELNQTYFDIMTEQVDDEAKLINFLGEKPSATYAVCGDAKDIKQLLEPACEYLPVDYVITSPPYWDVLHRTAKKGKADRRTDRKQLGLPLVYSDNPLDLGNVEDYDSFLDTLVGIYRQVYDLMRDGSYMTVLVKNIKKGDRHYPLAWDIGKRLGEFFSLQDEKIWCMDNQTLFPYGMGNTWVSNIMHTYCLIFRKVAS